MKTKHTFGLLKQLLYCSKNDSNLIANFKLTIQILKKTHEAVAIPQLLSVSLLVSQNLCYRWPLTQSTTKVCEWVIVAEFLVLFDCHLNANLQLTSKPITVFRARPYTSFLPTVGNWIVKYESFTVFLAFFSAKKSICGGNKAEWVIKSWFFQTEQSCILS